MTLKGPARQTGDRWSAERIGPLAAGTHWDSGTFAETPGGHVQVSTGDHIFSLTKDGQWRQAVRPPRHQHGMAVAGRGEVVVAGDPGRGRRAFFVLSGSRWIQASDEFAVPRSYGEELRVAPDGSIWYVGFDLLMRWQPGGGE